MKHRSPRAFTLVEMITVIAVIIVLAGLVVGISGLVNTNAAKTRANAEMKAIASACDAYKIDNGSFPQTGDTDKLDPRKHVNPASGSDYDLYKKANRDLYKALTGDYLPDGAPDGKTDPDAKSYITFNRNQLSFDKVAGSGEIKEVKYIQDPFGLCYGYSTIAAKTEADYLEKLAKDPSEPRPEAKFGYNPTYDLWSTSGGTTLQHQAKWVKNWGGN
jgi:type II secretory pathway pseudopilin PulG